MEPTVHFPPGTWAMLLPRDAYFPDVETVMLWPAGPPRFPDNWALDDAGTCEFSRGNPWPDTTEMVFTIEDRLTRGLPVRCEFRALADALNCLRMLEAEGVHTAPGA